MFCINLWQILMNNALTVKVIVNKMIAERLVPLKPKCRMF